MIREWLNRWINPPINEYVHKGVGYKDRDENKCWCGAGLVTFYSLKNRQCVDLVKCGRVYDLYDGVEIKHQR
jgi:hypothetical protein